MVKKITLFILLFIFFPIIILANSYNYNDSIKQTNNYITQSKYSTRNKYLIMKNQKFIMIDGRLGSSNSFYNGGMINYEEFCLSTGNSSCKGSSFLIIPNKYWTLTGTSNSRYYINNLNGADVQSDLDKSNVRVSEFIKPNIKVRGEGSYSNPWVFDESYYVELYTSDKKLGHFGTQDDVKTSIDGYATKCANGQGFCFEVYIYTPKGYANDPIDGCGLVRKEVINKTDTYRITRYTMSNITSDVSCVLKFKRMTFNLVFHDRNYNKTFEREVTVGDCFGSKEKMHSKITYFSYTYCDPHFGHGELSGQCTIETIRLQGFCSNRNVGKSCSQNNYAIDASGYLRANTKFADANRCWIYEGNVDLYSFNN